ncbi:putative phage tail protein [Propionispira raffinosivorans]|uniref:putative phage tail protein n=1 Tax=Propionispira raffinosivorans TaxID=86959 RepID=UPI00036D7882|nr:putative phage tail protein [Propionispira raffinosivorans]
MRDVDVSRYYPSVVKEAKEFHEIAARENEMFKIIWLALDDCLNDQFILDSTKNGVSRREIMLKITPKASDTLDERKFRLLMRYNEMLPYTVPDLKQKLANLCGANGYRINLVNNLFSLEVRVELIAKKNLESVQEMLERIVPMNMTLFVDLLYNQHFTLGKLTHEQLRKYTHNTLRNEVIPNG